MSNVDINNLVPTTVPQEEVATYLADVEQRLKQQQAEFNNTQLNTVAPGSNSATVKPFKVGSYAENVQQHLARNSALKKARLLETTEQVKYKLDPEAYTNEMVRDFDSNPSMTKADFYTKYGNAPSYAKDKAWASIEQTQNLNAMERALRAATAVSDRSIGQVAEDTARSIGAGALQTANVAVGLVELATGETEVGKALTAGAEALKSGYSDKTKAQQEITQEEFAKVNAEIADKQLQEGRSHTSTWWEVIGDSVEKAPEAFAALADNPTALTAMALESGLSATLPAIAAKAAKAAVKGAAKEVVDRVGTTTAVAAMGATEGVSAAQEARQQVDQMSYDKLAQVSPLYNELIASGKKPEEAKLAVKENVFRSTAVLSGLSAAAIGKVSGVGKLESELLDGVSGALGKANKFLKNVTGQFIEEGTQEAVANVIGESVIQDLADVTQKVGGELITDFAAGAAAGALTAGAVSGTVETLGALSAGGQKIAKSAEGVQQVKAIKQAIDTGNLDTIRNLDAPTADETETLMARMFSKSIRSTEGLNTPEGVEVFKQTFERLGESLYPKIAAEAIDAQTKEAVAANPSMADADQAALMQNPEFVAGVKAKLVARYQSPELLKIQETYSKLTENEDAGLKQLLGAFSPDTDTDTDTVNKTIRVLGSSPDKASLDQLKAVQNSKAYTSMTPNQKTVVDSLVAFKSVSNTQEVSDFIRTGGKDKANVSWKGAANYMQAFSNALKMGNLPVANAQIEYLRDVFIPSQEAKYVDYQTRQAVKPTPARAKAMDLMQKDTAVLQNTLNYMTAFLGSQQDAVDASIAPEAVVTPQPGIPLETPTEGEVAAEVPAPTVTTSTEKVEGAIVEPKTDGNVPIKSAEIKAKLEAPIEPTPEDIKAQYTTKINEAVTARPEQKALTENKADLDKALSDVYDEGIAKGLKPATVTNLVEAAVKGDSVEQLSDLVAKVKSEIAILEQKPKTSKVVSQIQQKTKQLKAALVKTKVFTQAKKAVSKATEFTSAGNILMAASSMADTAKEYFTSTKVKGILSKNPGLLSESAATIAAETGLTDRQAATLKKYVAAFTSEFNKLLVPTEYTVRNPFAALYGDKGIDAKAIDIIATTSLAWFMNSHEIHKYRLTDDDIKAALGKDKKDYVAPEIRNKLRYSGVNMRYVQRNLPDVIYKALGLSVNKRASVEIESKAKESLGLIVLDTLSNMDVLRIGNFMEVNAEGKTLGEQQFVKASMDKNGPTGRAKVLMDTFTGSEDVLGNLVGEVYVKAKPSFIQPTKDTIKASIAAASPTVGGQKVPDKVIAGIVKHSQEPQIIFPDMLAKWSLLDRSSKLLLAGYIDENGMSNKHISEHESILAMNESLEREVDALDNWIAEVEANQNAPFYFDHVMWSNDRFGLNNVLVNPQASKIVRRILGSQSNLVTIGTAEDSDTLVNFKYSVVANIFGFKITEKSEAQMLEAFDALASNPEVQAAVAELNAADTESRAVDVSKLLPVMGEGTIGFQAIVAYQAYSNAVQTGSDFTTSLPIEIDGKTNGVAIALLQFYGAKTMEELKALMEKAGVFTTDMDYPTFRKNPLNLDHYQNLAIHFVKNLYSGDSSLETNDLVTALLGDLITVEPISGQMVPTSLARALAKDPTMTSNYGAGIAGVLRNLSAEIVANMYADIVKAKGVNKFSGVTSDADTVAKAENTINTLNTLMPEANFSMTADLVTQTLTPEQTEQLIATIEDGIRKPLQAALDEVYGPLKSNRTLIQNGIQYAFEQFQTAYHKAYWDKLQEVRKTSPDTFALNSVLAKEVFDSVASMMPIVSSYLRKGQASGLPMIKEERIAPVDFYWRMNTSAKLYNKANPKGLDINMNSQKWEFIKDKSSGKATYSAKVEFLGLGSGKLVVNFNGVTSEHRVGQVNDGYVKEVILKAPEYSKNKETFAKQSIVEIKYPNAAAKTLNLNTGKSEKTTYRKRETTPEITDVVNNGVAGPVVLVQSIDAGVMFELFSQVSGLNVHDAYYFGLGDASTGAEKFNQAFFDVNKNYSIPLAVADMIDEVVAKTGSNPNPGFVTSFRQSAEAMESAKQDFLSQVVMVNQYTHNRGGYYPNGKPVMDTLEQMTDAFAAEVKRDLGSSPLGMGTFVPTYTDTLHSNNAEAIFTAIDTMGAADPVQDTPEHKAHLAMLMNQLITKLIKPTKLLVQQMAPATVGRFEQKLGQPDEIKLAFGVITPASAVPQSRQEVFVHELIHAIEPDLLEKGSKERNQIEWLHQLGRKYLTPLDLLPVGVQHTQNQIDAATAVYEYIFRNTGTQRTDTTNKANLGLSQARYKGDGISEFLAYGLTNPAVMGALHRLFDNKDAKAEWERGGEKLRRKTEQNSQLFTRMADAFTAMLDAFLAALNKYWNKVNGVENKPADEALLRLVMKLAGVENKAVTRTEKLYEVWNQGANSKAGQAIHDYVLAPLSKFMRNSNMRISRSVGGLIDKAGKSDAATLMGILSETEKLAQLSKDNFAVALTREMIGSTKDSRMFDALMRQSKHNIDSVQATITNSTRTLVRDKFSNQIDDTRSASITRGLLKTDASALWDGNANNLKDLFADPSKLKALIANLSGELKTLAPDYADFMKNSAENLGYFMATGKLKYDADLMFNASQIANLVGLEAKPNYDVNAAMALVDKLASAHAIANTNQADKDNVVSVITEELGSEGKSPTVNGVQFLLDLYKGFKEQSLEQLFSNNPAHTMKGYVKETYNPNFGLSAMPEHEAMEYVRKGGAAFKLGKDNKYDPSDDQLFLVKSELLALETRVRGIISPTNLKAKGSDLFTSYLNAGHSVTTALQANDDVRNIKRKRRVANKKMNSANPVLASENSLMPVWDTAGNVSGYRYMMSEKNKIELLERNDRFDDVIAHSRGSMVNKVNSAVINSNTVKGLKIDYDKHYRTRPNDFLAIHANSDDKELREMWFLLPEQMRAEINDEFGEDVVYVRKEFFRLTFGLRKANVAQMGEWFKEKAFNNYLGVLLNQIGDMLQHKYVINTERVLKEITSMAADVIVVKTGATLLGNVISNALILATEGIGIVYAARKQREAWVFMKKYQRDTVKLAKLTMELKSQALTNSERKSIQAEIASTQDSLAANKVTKMVDAGMFQSIIEDVSMLESGFEYAGKVEGFIQPYIDKVPPVLRDLGNVMFMTHKTSTYQFMRESTQLSDFVARYTMMEHLMEMGDVTYEEAVAKTMDYFINYEVPTHKYLQYGNDIGLFMFTKFFFRIQKVLVKQLIDKPLNVLALIAGQKALGVDPSDIYDSTLFIGVNPLDKFNFNLAQHSLTVAQPHALNITDGI